MPRYAYDLHIHTCLSPCGDELMTHGLTIPRAWGDYMATQFHLVAVD